MSTRFQVRRRAAGQTAGPPPSALSGEISYNMTDGKLYIGYGDDGSGNATSVKAFAEDDYTGGGSIYTASGDGIELTGSNFALNYTEIGTGLTATNVFQPKDADLTAIAALGATAGFLKKTGADAWTIDTSSYLTTTTAGTTYQPLDGDLTSIAGLAGTAGVLTKTGANTWTLDTTDMATQAELNAVAAAKANTVHTHAASDITSGVFDIARIPVLPGNTTVVSSGSIANLSAPQQTAIETGTIVTTTDGRRWVYNTGSKTAEASYVELADTTPEWSVIANKPAFATVATSGSYLDLINRPAFATVATSGAYADLSGKPTLGTMASQNANAVAITGGTIDGVILDGGTF